jgi:hypothetical protein
MDPLRVEVALLRAQLPDLVLRPGMQLTARVLERLERHGVVVLAGVPLTAELPDEVQAGDVLRLTVAETGAERVVLRIADAPPPPPVPPAGVPVPLPGGATAHVVVEEREASGGAADDERHEVRLTYASAALGRLELHLALVGDGVRVAVRARAGAPFALAEGEAAALRDAIAAVTGRPAEVRVSARHDPLDVYA